MITCVKSPILSETTIKSIVGFAVKVLVNLNSIDDISQALIFVTGEYHYDNKLTLVKMLLDNGANVNAVDKYGDNAVCGLFSYVHDCQRNPNCGCTKCVNVCAYERNQLRHVQNMNHRVIKLLHSHGIDLNCVDRFGGTALCYSICAKENNFDDIVLLLELGSNPNCYSYVDDQTILTQSFEHPNWKTLVPLLMQYNTDINFYNSKGKNVFFYICANDNCIPMIKLLIDNGADINSPICSNTNRTLLMAACIDNNVELVQMLLKMDHDFDSQDYKGYTALMFATKFLPDTDQTIIRLLLNHGANINIKNNKGKTVLDYAKNKHNNNIDMLFDDAIRNPIPRIKSATNY